MEPGTFVVCVDDWFDGLPPPIVNGIVYTIASYGYGPMATAGQYAGTFEEVTLVEAVNPYSVPEGAFSPLRFRPLKDSALDCFTALLEPAPKETEAA